MKTSFFSIIIATYNSSKTLQNTLDSLNNQTFLDFEVIIVDGNSVDHTMEIITKFEKQWLGKNKKIKIISEPDSGIYDAWNKGIKLATSDWIAFIGSDDYYLPNGLELYHMKIVENPTVNYISSCVQIVDNQHKKIRKIGMIWDKNKITKYMNIAHVGSMHHRKLFEQFGSFDTNYKIAGDYDFILRCRNQITAAFIPEITATMMEGGISQSNIQLVLKETHLAKMNNKARNYLLSLIDWQIAYIKYIYRKISR